MKLLGLTGGIGMGKTTVANLWAEQGVNLIDTDALARDLVAPGQPALAEIRRAFGEDLVAPSGELRRDVLARMVFSDPKARGRLEKILHPRIRRCWQRQAADWRAASAVLGVVVIPLLFETEAEQEFNEIVCVACSTETQFKRLLARGWNDHQIHQRLGAQLQTEAKMARSDRVIWTEGTLESTHQQAMRILGSMPAPG